MDWNTPIIAHEKMRMTGSRMRLLTGLTGTEYETLKTALNGTSCFFATPYMDVHRGSTTQMISAAHTVRSGFVHHGALRRSTWKSITKLHADAGYNNVLLADKAKYAPFGVMPHAAVLHTSAVIETDKEEYNANIVSQDIDFARYAWAVYSGAWFVKEGETPVYDVEKFTTSISTDQESTYRTKRHAWAFEQTSAIAVRNIENDVYPKKAPTFVYGVTAGLAESKPVEEEVVVKEDVPKIAASSENEFPRPNGEMYLARKVVFGSASVKDVDLVREARKQGLNVLLKGRPGTGKTALCDAALDNLQTIECDASTESSDFLGSYVPTGHDSFEWQWGPLAIAAMNGYPILVDEIAMCDPRELPVLYSAMDGRNKIHVTANPSHPIIDIQEGFYVIAACNPDVPGAVMSDALLSRFPMQIEVTTDYDMLRKLGVDKDIVTVASNLAKQCESGTIIKAPQTRELLAFKKIKETFGLEAALANFIGSADPNDEDIYRSTVSSAYGKKVEAIKI